MLINESDMDYQAYIPQNIPSAYQNQWKTQNISYVSHLN